MDDETRADLPYEQAAHDDGEVIDSRVLLAELRAKRLSRNAIIDELMRIGLTLDEATDAFDDDAPIRLVRSGGELRRLDPPPLPDPLEGLGGWLLLPALNLVLVILSFGRVLVTGFDTWATADGSRTALLLTLLLLAAFFAFLLFTAWLFFSKHRWAPRCYIAMIVVLLAATAFVAFGLGEDEQVPTGFLSMMVYAAVWIPYFLGSERVKNTFVR